MQQHGGATLRDRVYAGFLRFAEFTYGNILRWYFPLTCKGCEHLSELRQMKEPVIIVFNHNSHLDVQAICVCLGAKFTHDLLFPAKAELFDSTSVGWLIKIFPTIPVHRDQIDIAATKQMLHHLKQGKSILISPEGTRSTTGQQLDYNPSFVRLAMSSGARILPVALFGTRDAQPKGQTFAVRKPVAVHILPPVSVEKSVDRANIQDVADRVKHIIDVELGHVSTRDFGGKLVE